MHPDLVGPAGTQLGAQQTITPIALVQGNDGVRRLARCIDLDAPLARRGQPFQQGLAQMLLVIDPVAHDQRSEEHTSELQSLMRTSYAVFCLTNKPTYTLNTIYPTQHTAVRQVIAYP